MFGKDMSSNEKLPAGLEKHGLQYRTRITVIDHIGRKRRKSVALGADLLSAVQKMQDMRADNQWHAGRVKVTAESLMRSVASGATRRNIPIEIGAQDVAAMLERCRGRCEATGMPLALGKSERFKRNPLRPSIDRIDNAKGYTPDNCRVVSTMYNIAVNEWGDEYLHLLASYLLNSTQKKAMAALEKRVAKLEAKLNG